MDLCSEMLDSNLRELGCVVEAKQPVFRGYVPKSLAGKIKKIFFNSERLVNRFLIYPRTVRRDMRQLNNQRRNSDNHRYYHVVDQSYSQLLFELPIGKSGVYCHDLDAFDCILSTDAKPRPFWFRRLVRKQLNGLMRASVVFHSTKTVREQIIEHQLIDERRLVHAPYGIAEEFHIAGAAHLDQRPTNPLSLMHVGANMPRKRFDLLLDVFGRVRHHLPDLQLIKVGGNWNQENLTVIRDHDLAPFIQHHHDIDRKTLASLYSSATLVLVTSDSEGFGLPVIEALASGAPVLCSDIPVLREVGGNAALYAPVGDANAWGAKIVSLLTNPKTIPNRNDRLAWASQFSWRNHATIIRDAYLNLCGELANKS